MRSSTATSASYPSSPEPAVAAAECAAVELRGVAKYFQVYEYRTPSLREVFARTLHGLPLTVQRTVFQLRDLDLLVARGEGIALLGANGSGKSTALRLIAGIYAPSSGSVAVRGRVTAVIELGTGLHPELTGRENIGLYASVLGLSRAEISALEPAAIAFAEVGEFLDVPIRLYSTGMRARLAFAVALCTEPDVLLLDEVLAVGDEAFRQRCLARLGHFRARGGTLIAVSHDLTTLAPLCSRAVWLDRGAVRASGGFAEVAAAYLASATGAG
jgi:ABC-type polysaccharide/polyol phosphate transport system ATPase subunit